MERKVTLSNEHWKARFVNKQYLGVWALWSDANWQNERKTLTISGFTREDVFGDGGKKTQESVATFAEIPEKLILKATNCKRIEKALGTPNPDKWVGKKIVLRIEMEKIKGQMEHVLRVSTDAADYAEQAPKKTELTLESPEFERIVQAIKSGSRTMERLKERYAVSEAVELHIVSLINAATND